MPRITLIGNEVVQGIAADLRKSYGGMMTVADIKKELGYTDQRPAKDWAADLPAVKTSEGNRPKYKYRVMDVAQKIANSISA